MGSAFKPFGTTLHTRTGECASVEELADACQRLLAAILLIAALPLVAVAAAVILILSRRSPFVSLRRVGRNGTPFWILKLRTMWTVAEGEARWLGLVEYVEDEQGPEEKSLKDPRVTSGFASLCRRHSIDELPQLVHVLSGRMALVGPRPLTRAELTLHYGQDAKEVLRVKPGLTGLWQVMGRNRLTYDQRRSYDLYYVRHRSVRLDLAILARTVPQVLLGRGAW